MMPVLVLLGLAAHVVSGTWAERAEVAALGEIADAAGKISRLIHELQRERGMSAVFLGSEGSQMRAELSEQRQRTDQELSGALQAMKTLAAFDSGEIKSVTATAQTELAPLESRRKAIDGQTVAATEAAAYFTGAIAKLLGVTKGAANMSSRGDTTTALSAYLSLIEGKEHAGQERALIAGGLTAGRFDLPTYRKVLWQVAAQDVYLAGFLASAKSEQREFYARTSGEAAGNVAKMREVVANGGLSGEMGGLDGASWFKTATNRIDMLKTTEDRIASDLVALTSAKRAQANWTLILIASTMVVCFMVTVALAWLMARSITRPVAQLSRAMKTLAGGDKSVEIRERSAATKSARWPAPFRSSRTI
jgi:HAMP domain-containing protein